MTSTTRSPVSARTVPSSSAIGEGRFRELVTVHGTAMVFFFVLPIVGIALSPEYVFAAAAGGLPDDTSFGVFWIDRSRLEAAIRATRDFGSTAPGPS